MLRTGEVELRIEFHGVMLVGAELLHFQLTRVPMPVQPMYLVPARVIQCTGSFCF